METIRKLQSWEISDDFWSMVCPLVPKQNDPDNLIRRKSNAGRKPMDPRKVFEAIVFVLRTGIQWKALPKEKFGSSSSIHKYFQIWEKSGLFSQIWKKGLAEYEELEGIGWRWQSIDGSMNKAPLAQEAVGPNPTDRGKKRQQKKSFGRCLWSPAVPRRERGQPA
jgi:transposase